MDRNTLAKEFTKAVAEMRRTHGDGTYYWIIGEDEKNDWAIVLGWGNGFEENPNDDCTDGTWRICAKLAFQSKKSIMQCDYEVDWLMPYDEETMGVYNNEVSIYPNTDLQSVVNWLLECYDSYFNDDEEDENEILVDKIASFLEREENWDDLRNAYKINDRSEALRRLLREALKG